MVPHERTQEEEEEGEGEEVALADFMPDDTISKSLEDPALATIEILEGVCMAYAARGALAWAPDPEKPVYSAKLTYAELWSSVQHIATGMARTLGVKKGDFVATCGFISVDYVVADLSIMYLGAVGVPLPLNVTDEDLAYILQDCEASVAICSEGDLPTLLAVLPSCPSLHTVVLMDTSAAAAPPGGFPASVTTVTTLEALRASGAASAEGVVGKAVARRGAEDDDPLVCLMYTSGSTGRPKGAMYTDSLVGKFWRSGFNLRINRIRLPGIGLAFMPFNHIMGRVAVYQTLAKGGLVSFMRRPDMSTLLEDMGAVRPCSLTLVPRVGQLLYDAYTERRAVRLAALGPDATPEAVEALEAELMGWVRRDLLGGRLRFIITASAPTAPAVMVFLREAAGCPVLNGYGSTELGGITVDGRLTMDVVEAKLEDVPELGYSVHDHPYPRGELCVKSRSCIKGYFKNPEATAKLISSDGWVHTGDVMEKRGDSYVYIDRKNQVIKLAQGEYVAISRLEALYTTHPEVEQAFIYGNSLRSYVLAVVVPSPELLAETLDASALKDRLRRALESTAKQAGLASYEVPRDFVVEREPFSRANSLLTDSCKPARRNLRQRYAPVLEDMYEAIEEQRRQRLATVSTGPNATTEDKVRAAVEITLGVEVPLGALGDYSFGMMGGDSLSAVRLTEQLEALCGVRVPVAWVLHPAASLATLVGMLEAAGGAGVPEEDQVYRRLHGEGQVGVVEAEELRVDKVLDPALLGRVEGGTGAAPRVVLLTGANGFLGRFLAFELLRRVGGVGGRLVCVVRGKDAEAARARLMAAFGKRGTKLRDEVEASADRLEVHTGDVSMERLGLEEDVYARLSDEVDLVLHAGALVNHALTYKELFGPNVLGSLHIMDFCLRGRRKKPLHFVSTVAVGLGQGVGLVTEDMMGSKLQARRDVGAGYAGGYSGSKWVVEVLLQDLHARTGLPVAAYRCSMILPHADPAFLGQINASDVFTRLLAGLIYTGLAPASFGADPQRVPPYDGLPVNLVAGAIVASSCGGGGSGCRLLHVVNPYRSDGATLDDIAGWVGAAGYTLKRVGGYQEWVEAFRKRLEALAPAQRNASILPLLSQWARPLGPREEGRGMDAAQFVAAVREAGMGEVPRINRPYVELVLGHMKAVGLIQAPSDVH